MLQLLSATDPSWAPQALDDLDALLVDHAHCEKKAAGTAFGLLFRYPDEPTLQHPLTALAREELAHFAEVLRVLERRGVPFGAQVPSSYGSRLQTNIREMDGGRPSPNKLVDTLLVAALIEARSSERLELIARNLEGELQSFYQGLHAAEERHRQIYVDLALGVGDADFITTRLAVLQRAEANALASATPVSRIHGGTRAVVTDSQA